MSFLAILLFFFCFPFTFVHEVMFIMIRPAGDGGQTLSVWWMKRPVSCLCCYLFVKHIPQPSLCFYSPSTFSVSEFARMWRYRERVRRQSCHWGQKNKLNSKWKQDYFSDSIGRFLFLSTNSLNFNLFFSIFSHFASPVIDQFLLCN